MVCKDLIKLSASFLVLTLASCWESRKSPSEYSQEAARIIQNFTQSKFSSLQVVPQSTAIADGVVITSLETDHSVIMTIGVKHLSGVVTGVHLHLAAAGRNGPIVADLVANKVNMQAGKTSLDLQATWKPSTSEWQRAKSGELYVDVHTTKYPNGEVRAQVVPASGW